MDDHGPRGRPPSPRRGRGAAFTLGLLLPGFAVTIVGGALALLDPAGAPGPPLLAGGTLLVGAAALHAIHRL